MLRLVIFLVSLGAYAIRALFFSRTDLLTQKLALSQQIAGLERQRSRPPLAMVSPPPDIGADWPNWWLFLPSAPAREASAKWPIEIARGRDGVEEQARSAGRQPQVSHISE